MRQESPFGVVGLGQIGGGIAASLARAGTDVVGFDPGADAQARAEGAGVRIASSLSELLASCTTILTCLPSVAAIEQTYFEPGGIVSVGRPGLLTIECSTTPLELARRITAKMAATGALAVEAPVIGRGAEADAGTLLFFVAGEAAAVERAADVLALIGRGHVHIGGSGTASVVKLVNNAIGAVTICALAEAMALVADFGIERTAFVKAVEAGHGAGYSVVFQRHAEFMAEWRKSQRAPSEIELKDARSLRTLMGVRDTALPFLSKMTDHYEALLQGATRPQAEMLAADAEASVALVASKGK